MLRIPESALPRPTGKVLDDLQELVNKKKKYPARVLEAGKLWKAKKGKKTYKEAFDTVRLELGKISYGVNRCAYCEDSLGDEIEHLRPKSLFPQLAFRWENYAFACGPCNGPKSNRFAIVEENGAIDEFVRKPDDKIVAPQNGMSGLIDPRTEDPLVFLDLDLGGVTRKGMTMAGTFMFMPALGLNAQNASRADYTIKVLDLNREMVRKSRKNAFQNFCAQMSVYVRKCKDGESRQTLDEYLLGLLSMPHITVFAEMRRQRKFLPKLDGYFEYAPELLNAKILPGLTVSAGR